MWPTPASASGSPARPRATRSTSRSSPGSPATRATPCPPRSWPPSGSRWASCRRPPGRCSTARPSRATRSTPSWRLRGAGAGGGGLLGPRGGARPGGGRLHESREALLDVLALLPSERTPERLAVVAQTAGVEHLLGRHGDARRRLLAALEDAPQEGRTALALEMAAAGFYAGDATAMRDWSARASADAGGQDALRAGAEAIGALGAQRTGDPDAATVLLDRALSVARAMRQDGIVGRLAITRARFQQQRLHLGEAMADVEVAEEGARLQGVQAILHKALWTKALLHHDRGESTEAERVAAEATELHDGLEPSALTRTGACAVAAIHEDQDPERCIREMTAAGGAMLADVDETWRTWLLLVLVRAGIATGRHDEA